MKFFFEDPQYSFELLRAAGHAPYGGSDIGECLATAYRIVEGDDESWYREWMATARRIHGYADECMREGYHVSAREAYLRASNYYRTAEFFLHADPRDQRALDAWRESRSCFRKVCELAAPPIEPIEIPYEGTKLPGYFLKPSDGASPKPTLILHTGFDGTAEELYFGAVPVLRRNMNCLIFEGPGQGAVLREQNLYFRPDWERVVTPVVDYAVGRPDVDGSKLALMGISFGGYLAPRAAAFEKRLAACIANGGVFDFFASWYAKSGMKREDIIAAAKENPAEFDAEVMEATKHSSEMRWAIQDGLWKFDAKTPSEYALKVSAYHLGDVVEMIECRTLVVDSEKEQFLPGQARILFDRLTCRKDFMPFTAEECAEEHCQVGASVRSHQRIFDWLEEAFSCRST